jgi:hypothetical protein
LAGLWRATEGVFVLPATVCPKADARGNINPITMSAGTALLTYFICLYSSVEKAA